RNEPGPAARGRAGLADASFYARRYLPICGTGGTGRLMSQESLSGIVSSWELSACSQATSLPLYAAIRPRIAVSVLSATFFSSLIGLPERLLAIRSVCSCTYGSAALRPWLRDTTGRGLSPFRS